MCINLGKETNEAGLVLINLFEFVIKAQLLGLEASQSFDRTAAYFSWTTELASAR